MLGLLVELLPAAVVTLVVMAMVVMAAAAAAVVVAAKVKVPYAKAGGFAPALF